METRIAPFNEALARALGLRFEYGAKTEWQAANIPGRSVDMPRQDWRLYDGAQNPRAAVTERWLKHAGNSHLWIAGVDTYSDTPFYFLDRLADIAPELPHLREWAERFRPKNA